MEPNLVVEFYSR